MKFCSECGQTVNLMQLTNSRERFVCNGCGIVHYQNPKIVVSCLATWEHKALWMKRAEQPRMGFWSVPSGFMEFGENLREAACRELFEETNVTLAPEKLFLYGVGSVANGQQVYVSFRAQLESPVFSPGPEAQEVALFSAEDLPWDELAYPGIRNAVEIFYREMKSGEFGLYLGDYSQREKMLEKLI